MAVENASNAGSSQPPVEAEFSRHATSLVRRLLVPKGVALLVGGGGSIGGVLCVVPPRGVYYLTAAGGATYTARYLVHWRMKYAEVSVQLARLVRVDLALAIAFDALGFASIVCRPSSEVMAASALFLFFAIMLVSGAMIVAGGAELQRGSEWLRERKALKWVESSLGPHADLFGKPFLWVMRIATPVRKASCYVVCLLAMLVIVGTAAGRASLPAIEKAIEPGASAKVTTTTTTATATARTSTNTAPYPATVMHETELPPPTYEQLCGRAVPGSGAPEPQAAGLRSLFAQTGAVVAGCAGTAAELAGGSGAWWTLGRCEGQVRSLALAPSEGPAVLMLQQVALFAQQKAERGELTGGSARVSSAHGDYQVIATTTADYVEAREDSSGGGSISSKPARSCTQLSDRDATYTLVPPALIELWLHLVEKAWAWPVAAGVTESGAKKFDFRAPAQVATAECSSEFQCTMTTTSGRTETSDSDGRSASELEDYAPPPIS